MNYSLTIFRNIFDNKTHRRLDFDSFERLEGLLYDLSKIERRGKKDAELISPATYQPDTTRANRNVDVWGGWAAIDVDDHEFAGDLRDEMASRFAGHRFVCYSTASSTIDHPKFRLVFPTSRRIGSDQIKAFWYALNTEAGAIGDRQTKDLSRMYYVPATYVGANNFIFSSHNGDPLDVDSLILKHPYQEKKGNSFLDSLSPELKEKVLNYRKEQMRNTDIHWSGIGDCPFWPKKLGQEYMTIDTAGWYHKMYQIMVAVASSAIKSEYPISASEIGQLCRELDAGTGGWYKDRPIEKEAERAIEYVYGNK